MAVELRIAGWKAENLRCPDHQVNFERSGQGVWPLALVQMPNGTGKTTTLDLLRVALGGRLPESWNAQRVRQFRKKGSPESKGVFEVVLLQNGRRVTLRLSFDFDEGSCRFTTTLPSSGQKVGFSPPAELRRFLRPDFVNLFVFDGELAERLLQQGHTNAEEAIEDLFQLKVLKSVAARVGEYWEQQVEGQSATESRGLSRRRNRVQLLRGRLLELRGEQRRLSEARARLDGELQARRTKYEDDLHAQDSVRDRIFASAEAAREAEARVQSTAGQVLRDMTNPAALSWRFANAMIELKNGFDRVQLPETAAREFFEELAEEESCVCGRPLDPESRDALRARAGRYLGSEEVALLNSIKSDVALLVSADHHFHERQLVDKLEALDRLITDAERLKTERDAEEESAVRVRPELQRAREEMAGLEESIRALDRDLEKFDSADDSAGDQSTFGIKIIERRLKDAEEKLAQITNTLQLRWKRDALRTILEESIRTARRRLGEEICREANERIAALMPNNSIKIDSVRQCLQLKDQDGGSVGETLSVAYAFLSTLFNRTEHQLPFVVDSPANPIDLRVRASVAALIPKLTRQFIAFTISSERDGFLDPLEASAGAGHIKYVTIFRKGDRVQEATARREPQRAETSDGLLVEGRDFFRGFHLESEG